MFDLVAAILILLALVGFGGRLAWKAFSNDRTTEVLKCRSAVCMHPECIRDREAAALDREIELKVNRINEIAGPPPEPPPVDVLEELRKDEASHASNLSDSATLKSIREKSETISRISQAHTGGGG